jgi:hypothetical protein
VVVSADFSQSLSVFVEDRGEMKLGIFGTVRRALGRGSLALCITCVVLGGPTARAQTASTAAPAPAAIEEAKRHFQRGLALLRDPEGEIIEGAYGEFKTAYELSRSPRVLGNIGYCAMKLERNSEAVAAYRDYVRLVPDIDPAERAQIAQDLVTMTDGAATINVRYTGPTAWTLVDERIPVRMAPVTNTYNGAAGGSLALLIRPGHHTFHVKTNGEDQGSWEMDATGGASFSHVFEPKPAPPALVIQAAEKPKPSRAPQIVTMGVGGALLVAAAVTGTLAYIKMNNLESECPNNVCSPTNYEDVSSARTLGTVTDTMLIAGGVFVVAGAVWLLVSNRKSGESESHAPSVAGACVPGECGLFMRGSF